MVRCGNETLEKCVQAAEAATLTQRSRVERRLGATMMMYVRSRTRKITLVLVTVVVLVYLANVASVSNELWKHPPFFSNKASPPPPLPAPGVDARNAARVNATGHVELLDPAMRSKLNLPPEYRVVHLDLKGAPPKVSQK